MVGHGLKVGLLESRRSSCKSHSHVFILGLTITYIAMFSSHVQAISVSCKSMNISLKYQYCGIHPGNESSYGVHDLDCFGKYKLLGMKTWNCVWKPGRHTSEKTYTLIVQQKKNYCKAHINITDISEEIKLFENSNMTVEVFENSETTNCSKTVFRGSPRSLLRCGPPHNVSFSRRSGGLAVNVSWQEVDMKAIKNYSVRYKAQGSLWWSSLPEQPQNGERGTVESLNTSLVYIVQIRCVKNMKCSQCVWSEAYSIPPELTAQPVIVNLEDTDIAGKKGRRLLTLTWKFSATELHDGYYVTVGKASGEAAHERMNTTQPEIRLILSYSAYHLKISAFNNASTSPAVSHMIPQREDEPSTGAKLNLTVHNMRSFTIYWGDNLITDYVCYSVEWMKKGHKAAHMSFYQNKVNYRTLTHLPEPLEPYQRYSITLHTRPDKRTCNMKHINNSESTYGTTQFYFIEGYPVSAPVNITTHNVTPTSAVLQWSSIPEDDTRGFLLGYIIHYTEYHHKGTETNITVDPALHSYELEDLKGGTTYEVQISGFTQAGAGVRSKARLFATNENQGYSALTGIITLFVYVASVLIFGSVVIERIKVILWPSIPHPGNSKAMHIMERPCELDLLKSINTLEVEEWVENSLQIVEKEDVVPADTSPSMLLLPLHASEDEGDSAGMICNRIQRHTEDYVSAENFIQASSSLAFPSPYTTMEMFQQVVSQTANASDT